MKVVWRWPPHYLAPLQYDEGEEESSSGDYEEKPVVPHLDEGEKYGSGSKDRETNMPQYDKGVELVKGTEDISISVLVTKVQKSTHTHAIIIAPIIQRW